MMYEQHLFLLFGLYTINFNSFIIFYTSDNNEHGKAAFSLYHFTVNLPMSVYLE